MSEFIDQCKGCKEEHEEFPYCENCPIHQAEQKRFKESLERASKIVATWPEWKRNILGRTQ